MNLIIDISNFAAIFAKIWHNFTNITQNNLKFLLAVLLLPLEIEKRCWILWLKFLAKILIKFLNFKLFSWKMAQNMFFWSTLLKFARLSDLETLKETR